MHDVNTNIEVSNHAGFESKSQMIDEEILIGPRKIIDCNNSSSKVNKLPF